MSTFGERLRQRRVERGLTQSQLGGEELSTSYVSRLEAGTRAPNARVVALLADRLHVDAQWLIDGRGESEARDLSWRVQAAEVALAAGETATAKQELLLLQGSFEPGTDERRHVDHLLAKAHERCAELDPAIELLEELVHEARQHPARGSYAALATDLARCYRESGDLHRAVEVAAGAVDLLTGLGLQSSVDFPRLVVTLAGASQERGDHAHAAVLLRRLLDDLGVDVTPRDRASALWNAALVAVDRGLVGEGMLLARRALQVFEGLDDARALGNVRTLLAWVILSDPDADPAEAVALLTEARSSLLAQGLQIDTAYAETELARASTALGRPGEAIAYAEAALERLASSPDALESARARTAMGHAMLALGQGSLAVAELQEAARLLRAQAASRQAASVWRDLAHAHAAVGDLPAATACFDEALTAAGVPAARDHLERAITRD